MKDLDENDEQAGINDCDGSSNFFTEHLSDHHNLCTSSILHDIIIPPMKSMFLNDHAQLVVEVIDTGIGIKENDQLNLFKVFGKIKASNHIN